MTSANGCGFWLVGGVLGVVIDPNEMSGAISGIKCTKNSDVSDWEWLWVWFLACTVIRYSSKVAKWAWFSCVDMSGKLMCGVASTGSDVSNQ